MVINVSYIPNTSFYPDDGGRIFLRNLTSSYGVWYCRRPQSLTCCHLYHRQNPPTASVTSQSGFKLSYNW